MAHEVTMRDVVDRLKQIMYPGFDRDIVSFGLVKNVQASNGHVAFSLAFSTQDESTRRQITLTAKEAVERMPGVQDVQITGPPPGQSATAQGHAGGPAGQAGQPGKIELPGVKSIVAVARMTVSPQRTVTAPPACWARTPVSMLTSLSPSVVE